MSTGNSALTPRNPDGSIPIEFGGTGAWEGGGSSSGGNVTNARQGGGTIDNSPFNAPPAPTYTEPATYVAPEAYKAPEWREADIEAKTQRKAAPGLRALRAQMQKVSGGYYENPNIKRMTLREALAGYGQGVENVVAGAETGAEAEYAREYGTLVDTTKTNYGTALLKSQMDYQGGLTKSQMDFQAKLAEYQNTYKSLYSDYMARTYGTGTSGTGTSGKKTAGGGSGVKWLPSTYNESTTKPSDYFTPSDSGYKPPGYYDVPGDTLTPEERQLYNDSEGWG